MPLLVYVRNFMFSGSVLSPLFLREMVQGEDLMQRCLHIHMFTNDVDKVEGLGWVWIKVGI